jgi:hypothetical protein
MQSGPAQYVVRKPQFESPEPEPDKRRHLVRAKTNLPVFHHGPLDYTKGAIRLLKVLPDLSSAGFIQCQIWHDDVDAQYACLSYVWGPESDQHTILLNGAEHRIRKNLFDFLTMAQPICAQSERIFWIDALCIDQDSIAERNHQVAQMGSIYSKAQDVVIWLGTSDYITRVFEFCMQLQNADPKTAAEAWTIWDAAAKISRLRSDWKELATHPYWTRAWITQEVLLGRRCEILVKGQEIELLKSLAALSMLLPGINKRGWATKPQGVSWNADMRIFNTYLEVLCGRREFQQKSLIELLHELPRRQSLIPRDRIYSLLSLASDAASVSIDYARSDQNFFLHMLDMFRGSMCLCLLTSIVNTLDILTKIYESLNQYRLTTTPENVYHYNSAMPLTSLVVQMPLGTLGSPISLPSFPMAKSSCTLTHEEKSTSDEQIICVHQICDRAEVAHWRFQKSSALIERDMRTIEEPFQEDPLPYKVVNLKSSEIEEYEYLEKSCHPFARKDCVRLRVRDVIGLLTT